MAIYPFILIKKDEMRNDAILINHERIHHRQQLELLIFPFYIIYAINYLYHLAKHRNHYQAYRHILFEREAYAMEKDFDYLKRRRMFAFWKY